jgi:hypothetical protein
MKTTKLSQSSHRSLVGPSESIDDAHPKPQRHSYLLIKNRRVTPNSKTNKNQLNWPSLPHLNTPHTLKTEQTERSVRFEHSQATITNFSSIRERILASKLKELSSKDKFIDIESDNYRFREPKALVSVFGTPQGKMEVEYKEIQRKLILKKKEKTKLIMSANTCIRGKVDLDGGCLPVLIVVDTHITKVTIYVGLDYLPTRTKFDLKNVGNSILIQGSNTEGVCEQPRIRFVLFTETDLNTTMSVKISKKPAQVPKKDVKEEDFGTARLFDEYYEMDLYKPSNHRKMANQSLKKDIKAEESPGAMVCVSVEKKWKDINKIVDFKISQVKLKKKLNEKEKQEKLMTELTRFERRKEESEQKLNNILEWCIRQAAIKAWIRVLIAEQFAIKLKKHLTTRKEQLALKKLHEDKTDVIQRILGPVLKGLVNKKVHLHQDFITFGLNLAVKLKKNVREARIRSVIGHLLKEMCRCWLIRYLAFYKISKFIKISNRWRGYMRTKQAMFVEFQRQLTSAFKRLGRDEDQTSRDRLAFHNLMTDSKGITSGVFEVFYNHSLREYLVRKVQNLSESCSVRNFDFYFHELDRSKDYLADLKQQAANRFQFHTSVWINRIAFVMFKRAHERHPFCFEHIFYKFKKRIADELVLANLVPVSLVRVRHFMCLEIYIKSLPFYTDFVKSKENEERNRYRDKFKTEFQDGNSIGRTLRRAGSFGYQRAPNTDEGVLEMRALIDKRASLKRIMRNLQSEYNKRFELAISEKFMKALVYTIWDRYLLMKL